MERVSVHVSARAGDLEGACFVWMMCRCCSYPQGGSRVLMGGGGSGVTPLCKRLTLVVAGGWGGGLDMVSVFPWHAALALEAGES